MKNKMMLLPLLSLGMLLILVLAGSIGLATEPEPLIEADGFFLPIGDPESGKKAFTELKCISCHQVMADPDLPPPTASPPGPMLGTFDAFHTPGELADAIVSPSHHFAVPEGRTQGGELSRMGDFRDVMTVRQLIDIVAYLKSQEE